MSKPTVGGDADIFNLLLFHFKGKKVEFKYS